MKPAPRQCSCTGRACQDATHRKKTPLSAALPSRLTPRMVRPRRSSLAFCLHFEAFGLAPGGKKTSALLFVQIARKRSAKEGRETGRGVKETHPPCRGNWWLWGHAAVVAVVVEAGRVRSHPISSEGRGTRRSRRRARSAERQGWNIGALLALLAAAAGCRGSRCCREVAAVAAGKTPLLLLLKMQPLRAGRVKPPRSWLPDSLIHKRCERNGFGLRAVVLGEMPATRGPDKFSQELIGQRNDRGCRRGPRAAVGGRRSRGMGLRAHRAKK